MALVHWMDQSTLHKAERQPMTGNPTYETREAAEQAAHERGWTTVRTGCVRYPDGDVLVLRPVELGWQWVHPRRLDDEWMAEAFTRATTGEPYDVPADIRAAAERIVRAYGIHGICDPMWIANVIARETGRGDGESTFYEQVGR